MTRIFAGDGAAVPVTVIQAGPCPVTQVKTVETDGYNALQIALTEDKEKHVSKAMKGHFAKAGRNRWLGRRPQVRGVAMNPIDHPLGGGEGRSSGGRHPVSPWGMPAKGFKTRDKNKASSRLIIKRRGQK